MRFAAVLSLLLVGSCKIVRVLGGGAKLRVSLLHDLEESEKMGKAKCVPKCK